MDGEFQTQEMIMELNIMEKTQHQIGINKKSIYEQEEIEDETLQMIVRPNQKTGTLKAGNTIIES